MRFFPRNRQTEMHGQAMHDDPEFETFTYGDPTTLKGRLRELSRGDMLVFYAGLEGWDHDSEPALYIVGYFVVTWAGYATQLPEKELRTLCGRNFHVTNQTVFEKQRDRLVLVKGGAGSRLLTRAVPISAMSTDRAGQPLKVLSPDAQRIFGDFRGKPAIQRSSPRWVDDAYVERAREYLLSRP